MANNCHEDVEEALKLLRHAEHADNLREYVRVFKNGIYLLNDCIDDVCGERVRHEKQVCASTFLEELKYGGHTIDRETWLECVLVLCIDLKREVADLCRSDPDLFGFFRVFLTFNMDGVSSELRLLIEEFLN